MASTCGCSGGYGGVYPYYSPMIVPSWYYPVTYAYPMCSYALPYYGLPLGYAYNYYGVEVAPQWTRGEHRVGNCLMICQ